MPDRGPISRLRHLLIALRGEANAAPRAPVAPRKPCAKIRRVAFCLRREPPP